MKHTLGFLAAIICTHFVLSSASAQEGPETWTIEKIECAGNEITSCSIIENDIYLRAGDKVNEEELENARLRLKTMGLFYDVQISLKKGEMRGQVIVLVQVQERSANYVNLGVDTTLRRYGIEGNSATVGVGNRNLFGLGKKLEAAIAGGTNNSSKRANLNYQDPNLFGSSKYFADIFLSSQKYGETEFNTFGAYVGRRIFDFSYIRVGTHGIFNSGSPAANIEYGWNTQDDIYFPTSGSNFTLGTSIHKEWQTQYQSYDFTTPLGHDYYFGLHQGLTFFNIDSVSASGVLSLAPSIARYFTFQREGSQVPDRMKVFANVGLNNPIDDGTRPSLYTTAGVSYVIDSFGKIDFTLGLGGIGL